LIAIFNHWT